LDDSTRPGKVPSRGENSRSPKNRSKGWLDHQIKPPGRAPFRIGNNKTLVYLSYRHGTGISWSPVRPPRWEPGLSDPGFNAGNCGTRGVL